MAKGERRKIRSNISELMSLAEQSTPAQPVAVLATEQLLQPDYTQARMPGAWRCLEAFCWAGVVSSLALGRGRATLEPLALSSLDVQTRAGRDGARSYIRDADPDLLLTSSSSALREKRPQTSLNGPYHVRRSCQQRVQWLGIPAFAQKTAEGQAERGRVVIAGHPFDSMTRDSAQARSVQEIKWHAESDSGD